MWDGPIEELTLTENAQPAIMAVSLAAVAALKSDFDVDVTAAKFVAGHSLGEYSALCAAGAVSVSDAAKLLKLRGQSMQKAVPVGQGAMAALLGAEMEQAEKAIELAGSEGIVTIANDNAPGQIVISGDKAGRRRRRRRDQGSGRAQGHAAACVRALPLPADGAGG